MKKGAFASWRMRNVSSLLTLTLSAKYVWPIFFDLPKQNGVRASPCLKPLLLKYFFFGQSYMITELFTKELCLKFQFHHPTRDPIWANDCRKDMGKHYWENSTQNRQLEKLNIIKVCSHSECFSKSANLLYATIQSSKGVTKAIDIAFIEISMQ